MASDQATTLVRKFNAQCLPNAFCWPTKCCTHRKPSSCYAHNKGQLLLSSTDWSFRDCHVPSSARNPLFLPVEQRCVPLSARRRCCTDPRQRACMEQLLLQHGGPSICSCVYHFASENLIIYREGSIDACKTCQKMHVVVCKSRYLFLVPLYVVES